MTTQIKRSLNFILGLFRVFYGLIWFVTCCGLLVAIIMPFSTDVKNDFCRIPISFVLSNAGTNFIADGTVHEAALTRSSGWLMIKDGPMILGYVNLLGFLIIAAVILYSLKKTIRIVERVRNRQVFLIENMLDMRRIAAVSLFLFFFLAVLKIAAAVYASSRLVSGPLVDMKVFGSSMDLDLGNLIFPLFLWALAEVFRSGIEIKAEHDLTI